MLLKKRFNIHLDLKLMLPVLFILIMGYIMIFSTTSFKGVAEYNDAYFFIKRHTAFLGLGMVFFLVAMNMPTRWYSKIGLWGYLGAFLGVMLTLIPQVGVSIGGASRWLNIGGFQFQPVEIMKFWWVVAISMVLANKHKQLHQFKTGILPVLLVMVLPILGLILQPDLGNTILALAVGFSLLLLSPFPLFILVVAIGVGVVGIIGSIMTHPYQLSRIQSFLNPWEDPLGVNYHIIQSFTAIGSGGVFGFGIGESRLKYFYLPLHYSDFIFSILCEEGGLILATLVLIAFCALFFRGIQIAIAKKRYSFQQFLALGLTFFLIYQALINICVVSGLFPITGIPLTLISYGGTSLLSSFFSLGVLHRLGKEA